MLDAMLNLFREKDGELPRPGTSQLLPSSPSAPPATVRPIIANPQQGAPASSDKFQIQYDPTLIARLEEEHQHMLAIYGRVDGAVAAEQWGKIPDLLLQFRSALTDHLLKEGVKLYAYLNKALHSEEELAFVFQSFKKEMGGIGKVVFSFFDKYSAEKALLELEQRAAFVKELRAIGPVLVSRIQREEEQLYAIYKNLQ
ncbi:hemerythrin domain-containing protein [Noviherbaspirillum sp.]|uniref:hemerythrin domain-containing protein n=1 Tax=Noviherbaspirillum sp. TaxID=1926288 RepID=UPI002B46C91C|nr:hemerythrin domain-containing protein [Noviherbaspirillum sp.]HJV83061.1 hemerythrin domain-containing protein [Noviherbaspirillum sp.]